MPNTREWGKGKAWGTTEFLFLCDSSENYYKFCCKRGGKICVDFYQSHFQFLKIAYNSVCYQATVTKLLYQWWKYNTLMILPTKGPWLIFTSPRYQGSRICSNCDIIISSKEPERERETKMGQVSWKGSQMIFINFCNSRLRLAEDTEKF